MLKRHGGIIMKFFNWLAELYEAFTIKFSIGVRIFIGVAFFGTIGLIILISSLFGNDVDEDNPNEHNVNNVFLFEEVEFASEAYFRCIGINAGENDGIYTLNLFLDIEQWNTDINVNQFELTTDMFELRLSDINSKSNMSVFLESLAQATVSAVGSVVLGGEINVIGETVDFASNYITGSIENSLSDENNVIKALPNTFEPYYPYEYMGETKTIKVAFELTSEFLSSSKSMVLSIDEGLLTKQQNIFLVLRPNTENYTVQFNLNGGRTIDELNDINVQAGSLEDLPIVEPTIEGARFLCWTTEPNNLSTKVRSIYFPTYTSNQIFELYAFYQSTIPNGEVVKINESVYMREDNLQVTVTGYDYLNQIQVKDEELNDIDLIAPEGFIYLGIDVIIDKLIEGDDHTLDNENDFFIENDHSSVNVEDYFGYLKRFESIKPVDDYTWIDMEIVDVGIYRFTLYFLLSEEINLDNSMLFLEIDFFAGLSFNSKSILLQY